MIFKKYYLNFWMKNANLQNLSIRKMSKWFFLAFLRQTFHIKNVNMKCFDILKNVSFFFLKKKIWNFTKIKLNLLLVWKARIACVGSFPWVSSWSLCQVSIKASVKQLYKCILQSSSCLCCTSALGLLVVIHLSSIFCFTLSSFQYCKQLCGPQEKEERRRKLISV